MEIYKKEKTVKIICSQIHQKNVFKMALEDPQKNIAKKYKKHEIVRLLYRFLRP